VTAPPARPDPADDIRRRRAFARHHIDDAARRGPVPRYGSPDWHALPYPDPRRWAAIIVAAEAWTVDGDDLPGRLRLELEADAAAEQLLFDQAFAAMAADIRRKAGRPSYAELQHRRGELTDEQLVDWYRANAAWLAGVADMPPRVPHSGAA
jgi:hypothetical protein